MEKVSSENRSDLTSLQETWMDDILLTPESLDSLLEQVRVKDQIKANHQQLTLELNPAQTSDTNENSIRISVMSDLHVLPEFMIADNEAFTEAMNSDRKLFEESQAALLKALQLIERNKSKVVFITGDMTKDGELESHQFVAQCLKNYQLQHPEVRFFVIPGNHDINNHKATHFNAGLKGGQVQPATFTTPQKFLNNYASVIASETIEYYKDSEEFQTYLSQVNQNYQRDLDHQYYAQGYLSYVDRVSMNLEGDCNGLTVICLDTNQYSIDATLQHKDGIQDTEGQISESQMLWLVKQAHAANRRNDVVMVLAHHAFMPHFYKQESILSPYIIQQWNTPFISSNDALNGKTPAQVLADLGIRFLFTGHMHAQDIARFCSKNGNELFDIETGSTISTPSAIRHLVLRNHIDRKESQFDLQVTSESLGDIQYIDRHKQMQKIEDIKVHGEGNLITNELIVGLWNHHLEVAEINSISAEKLWHKLLKKESSLDNMIYDLIESLIQKVFSEKDMVTINHQQFNSRLTYYRKTNQLDYLFIEISTQLMKFIQLKEKFIVNRRQLDGFILQLFSEIDQKILSNKPLVDKWINQMADQLLSRPFQIERESITFSRIVNYAYIGHLQGDEQQPDWMKSVIQRFKQNNEMKLMCEEMIDKFIDFIWPVLTTIEYPREYFNHDSHALIQTIDSNPISKLMVHRMNKLIGLNLGQTLKNLHCDIHSVKQRMIQIFNQSQNIETAFNHWSQTCAELLEGLTNENETMYKESYLEDNHTHIIQTISLENMFASLHIQSNGHINIEVIDDKQLQDIKFVLNQQLKNTLSIHELVLFDEVSIQGHYVNQFQNYLKYESEKYIYFPITDNIPLIKKDEFNQTYQQTYWINQTMYRLISQQQLKMNS